MDSQFKQRVTGAVILVLIAVLLIPELLTGPKSSSPGPTSSAPSPVQGEGAPLRSYDIDLSETRPGAAPAPSDAPAETGKPTRSPVVARPDGPAAAAPRVAAASSPVVDAPRSAARPPSPSATSVVVGDAARDAARAGASEDPSLTATATPGFAVQVGSFASRASADRLVADLKRRRFDPFVSPTRSGGRQLFRVRVGPVADRAAAQALETRLKAAGQRGSIVPLT